jgi:hypothetical protein
LLVLSSCDSSLVTFSVRQRRTTARSDSIFEAQRAQSAGEHYEH